MATNKAEERKTFLEHLLMGRMLTLPMFVATLVSTWYGGIFGVTRIAFEQGLYNFLTQGVFWYLTYAIFALFLVKRFRRMQALTLPELVGQLFGPKARLVASLFNFFNVVPIAYAVSLGLLSQTLFGGSLLINMTLWMVVVSIYAIFGGFRAIVFSDLVQFVVMCGAVALVFFFSWNAFGGLSFLKAHLPDGHFSLTGGVGWGTTLAWGLIALSTLVDPNFYQRVMAAKEDKTAKSGIFVSIFIWFLFDICTTAGGLYAAAVIPSASPDSAYLIYALQVVPEGVRGLVVAGIMATILSTIDSYLFIAATTITYDLWGVRSFKKWRYGLSVAFVSLFSIGLALVFDGDIKAIWKTLGSYSAGCLLLPVMAQIFLKGRFSEQDFLTACILSVGMMTYWRLGGLGTPWNKIDVLYVGILATMLGMTAHRVAVKGWPKIEKSYRAIFF